MVQYALEASRSPSIAVVDDDPAVRQALERLLRSADYEVKTYSSAEEFLRSPNPEKQSCIILDVQMPGISGLDLQQVFAELKTPIPIIFMTAHHDGDVRARAMAMGALGFLEKPFNDKSLFDLVKKALPS